MNIADITFCEVEKDPTSNIKWEILRKRKNKFLSLKIVLAPFLGQKRFEAAHKLIKKRFTPLTCSRVLLKTGAVSGKIWKNVAGWYHVHIISNLAYFTLTL